MELSVCQGALRAFSGPDLLTCKLHPHPCPWAQEPCFSLAFLPCLSDTTGEPVSSWVTAVLVQDHWPSWPGSKLAPQPDLSSALLPWTGLTVTELCLTLLIPTRSDHVLWIDSMACPQICLCYKVTRWSGVLTEPGHHCESTLQGHSGIGVWVAGPWPSWSWYWPPLLPSVQPLLFLTLHFHWQLAPCASGKKFCLLTSLS